MIQPIVKLVSRYAKPTLYNEGAELAVPCPYHEHGRDPGKKLWINVNKRVWICYKCDEKGTFRQLLRKFREVKPQAFADLSPEALDALSEPTEAPTGPVEHPGYTAKLPTEFEPLWGRVSDTWGLKALKYLRGRGLEDSTIELYRIGFCKYGEYAYRVIVPTYEEGRLVYWLGRDFTGKQEKKVMNPSKTLCGVGSKEWVFNLNVAMDYRDLVICEGVFDAIATGLRAVALFGKHASEIQLSKIRRIPFRSVTMLLDADAARDAEKLADTFLRLPSVVPCPEVRIATLPLGDPNSVPLEIVSKALLDARVIVGI